MKYFKLFSFIIALNFIKSSCFAMDVLPEEPLIHHLPNMSDIHQYLGDKPGESDKKRAKFDEVESASDLSGAAVVFDFDEVIGFLTTTDLGPEFALACRLFSCERNRVDETAFNDALDLLKMPQKDFENKKYRWQTDYFNAPLQYSLLEPSTMNLLQDLRKRGAKLFVCSGNPNDLSRTKFLKSLGFDGVKDYFHESKDKTRPVMNCLAMGKFSKVIFVDNRKQSVEEFVQNMRSILAQDQSLAIAITGLHYDYFHRTLTAEILAKQYRQIDEYVAEKKKIAAKALETSGEVVIVQFK